MFVREWNKGGTKTALLVHGIASSGATWHRLAKDLVDLDYHVIAPDLTGHGKSSRVGLYSIEEWSNDIRSLGIQKPDLMIGHSIGGLIVANLHDSLQPKHIVLIDPVFNFPRNTSIAWITKTMLRGNLLNARRTEIVPQSKALRWSDRDIKIALHNMRKWDDTSIRALNYRPDIVRKFLRSADNTLILRAKGSFLVPKNWISRLNPLRTSLVTLPATHNLHIDIYNTFWDHTQRFIEKTTVQPITDLIKLN